MRETKEETGYSVEIDGLVSLYHEDATKPLKHVFSAHVIGGDLHIQVEEIIDVKWLTYDEIKAMNDRDELRAAWIFNAITKVELKS